MHGQDWEVNNSRVKKKGEGYVHIYSFNTYLLYLCCIVYSCNVKGQRSPELMKLLSKVIDISNQMNKENVLKCLQGFK